MHISIDVDAEMDVNVDFGDKFPGTVGLCSLRFGTILDGVRVSLSLEQLAEIAAQWSIHQQIFEHETENITENRR